MLFAKERTKAVIDGTMQGILPFLKFTTEVGEDFCDGWLPTLDVSLWVDEETSEVKWKFYEKPTASATTVQNKSAMGGVIKTQILANDLVRRLLNTGRGLPKEETWKVVDKYSAKLFRSGHRREKVL